jgi:hypothetical protein
VCYVVWLSTSSDEDLEATSAAPGLSFSRECRDAVDQAVAARLLNEHKWYVGSASGCSCGFRHVTTAELGFGMTEEWLEEEADNLAATVAFIQVVRRLVNAGHKVDCIAIWVSDDLAGLQTITVDLDRVADDEFRFFERYQFVLESGGAG